MSSVERRTLDDQH